MKKLNRFYFDQAISIDNALTTNQIIHQLINQLNGVIEFVNNIETDAHEYTDAEISKLKIELQGEISDLNDLLDLRVSELTNLIDTKKNEAIQDANGYTDISIENLKTDYITPIIDRIDATLERLDLKIDYVDASLRNLVDETKAELIELISKGGAIYSGVTGERTNPEVVTKQLVDKVQHKNGVEWNDILTLITSQDIGETVTIKDDTTVSQQTNISVTLQKQMFKDLNTFDFYTTSYMFHITTLPSNNQYYQCMYSLGIVLYTPCYLNGMRINGDTLFHTAYPTLTSTQPVATLELPIACRANTSSSWEMGYYKYEDYGASIVPFKRVNKIELFTGFGIITFYVVFDGKSFVLPNYNSIISSCNNNKKWNTWDSLTYYTTKFLSEHLDTGSYKIPISNENEILYNNSPTLKNFYDNRT